MKYKDIYSVTRQEYTAFIEQIKPEFKEIKNITYEDKKETQVFSKKTGKHLCSRIGSENTTEKYYIFEMPEIEERQKPIPKIKLNLETKEEVQAFFSALNKLMEKKND